MSEVEFQAPDKDIELAMPQPTQYRILVEPYRIPERTQGNIILAEQTRDDSDHVIAVGKIVAKGPQAFKGQTKSGLPLHEAEPEIGQWVQYAPYTGHKIEMRDGRKYRIMNDDSIVAWIDDPEDYVLTYFKH